MGDMVRRAKVNIRDKNLAPLVLDGVDFPYAIDKAHGVKVEVNDHNVHRVIVAIQVDESVTITDHSAAAAYHSDELGQ